MNTSHETEDPANNRLSEPSDELKKRITEEVPWDDRLVGRTYIAGPGNNINWIRSLNQVVSLFKHFENFEVDFTELADWAEDVFVDHELANAIRDATEGPNPQPRIVNLIETRIKQCNSERVNEN